MPNRITWRDALPIVFFALFALAFQMQRWGGYDPAIFMSPDAAMYTAFAAGQANPQLFIGDPLLEHVDKYKYFRIAHILVIRALGRLTGDYGKGMMFLLGPFVFLHLLGYYILGRVLYQNRFWAVVLSIATAVYIYTPLGDDVGLMFDVLPGFAFGALLPYLLTAIIHFRNDTAKWKIIMACCAGLIYVHPVSAPAWVFGVGLLYAVWNPDGLGVEQRVKRAAVLATVALLVALPFALLYVNDAETVPNDPAKVAAIADAVTARIDPAFLHPIASIIAFSKWLFTDFYYTYPALAALLFLLCGRTHRNKAGVFITLVCGVVLFSAVAPYVEYLRAATSGVPHQTFFLRPLKYLVPVMFILSIWGFVALQRKMAQVTRAEQSSLVIATFIGLTFACYVHWRNPDIVRFLLPTISAWRHGNLFSGKTPNADVEAIRAVRRFTPENAKIFAASNFVPQIRFAALRPVVHAWKDGGVFAFTDYDALLRWYEIHKKLGRIRETGYSPAEVERTIVPIARQLDADYVLVYFGRYLEDGAAAPQKTGDTVLEAAGDRALVLDDNTRHIDLAGLINVWSNIRYGLYRVVK